MPLPENRAVTCAQRCEQTMTPYARGYACTDACQLALHSLPVHPPVARRSPDPICEEGDYVLIRAKVARASAEIVLVEIEHARDDGEPTPFTLVVEKESIAAVEVR